MVATHIPASLKAYLLPAVFALAGLGVAAGIATAPSETLNEMLARSGVAAVVPAAGPPIGVTGRVLLALLAGGLVAALGMAGQLKAWLAAAPAGGDGAEKAPAVRRADAHPDAPPCRPIRAGTDLGQPLPIARGREKGARQDDVLPFVLEPRAAEEQPLPADLDQPMSVFDPAAVPEAPAAPPEAVAPLFRAAPRVEVPAPDAAAPPPAITPQEVEEAGDAPADTVPTTAVGASLAVVTLPAAEDASLAVVTSPAAEDVPQEEGSSIAALLERLERGAQRRRAAPAPAVDAPPAEESATLDDTLRNLRRLATR
jgi:hypothetical protein